MKLPTILIVDSEHKVRRALHGTLTTQGYSVIESGSGEKALRTVRKTQPDLILLDINLPDADGAEICRQIRRSCDAPMIVATARSGQRDKILALDAGADDYVVKPFDWEELLARIRAFLRRTLPTENMSSFAGEGIAVDFERRQVTVRNRTVHLNPKEFDLLKYLIAYNGKVVAHHELFHVLWGPNRGQQIDNLRVVINNLRKKIETDPSQPTFIQTEPSIGYRFHELHKARKKEKKLTLSR